jgi:Flp pilus assembly protein TadG
MDHTTTTRDQQRGAAAVEFALVLPILITIVMGIIEYGFAFARHQVVNNAAREAARAGSNRDNSTAEITSKATDTAQHYLSINQITDTPTIAVTTFTISGTTAVQVDVSIPWKSLTGFGFLNHPARVSSRAVMRYQ